MSERAYRVLSPYNSALTPGPLEPDDLLWLSEAEAEAINADASGTLEPADAAWHECLNRMPGAVLEERQRVLERDLGRGPVVLTTLPHARRR